MRTQPSALCIKNRHSTSLYYSITSREKLTFDIFNRLTAPKNIAISTFDEPVDPGSLYLLLFSAFQFFRSEKKTDLCHHILSSHIAFVTTQRTELLKEKGNSQILPGIRPYLTKQEPYTYAIIYKCVLLYMNKKQFLRNKKRPWENIVIQVFQIP